MYSLCGDTQPVNPFLKVWVAVRVLPPGLRNRSPNLVQCRKFIGADEFGYLRFETALVCRSDFHAASAASDFGARFESAANRDFRDEMAEVVTELDFLLERLGNLRAPRIAGYEQILAIAGENDSEEKK